MLKPTQEGLSSSEFKEIKTRLLQTGEFNPEVWNDMNAFQKFWVNETKKSYRDIEES